MLILKFKTAETKRFEKKVVETEVNQNFLKITNVFGENQTHIQRVWDPHFWSIFITDGLFADFDQISG